MWDGFDPEVRRQLALIKQLTVRRHQTPVKEWPMVVDGNTLVIVREWPDGEVTAYVATRA
jgi:hypothetical protein